MNSAHDVHDASIERSNDPSIHRSIDPSIPSLVHGKMPRSSGQASRKRQFCASRKIYESRNGDAITATMVTEQENEKEKFAIEQRLNIVERRAKRIPSNSTFVGDSTT